MDNKHSISGTIIEIGNPYLISNGSKWKLDFVVRTKCRFPVDVCLHLLGENIELIKEFDVMDEVRVMFSITSYKGEKRIFNNLRAYYIEPYGAKVVKKNNSNYKPSF